MGRRRRHNKALPQRVYLRHGAYYFVHPNGKWERLGNTASEMYGELAQMQAAERVGTMDALIARYLREVTPGKAPATRKHEKVYAAALMDIFGPAKPESIRPTDIARFLENRPAKIRANREKALLSHIFTKAMAWGVTDFNPCLGVRRNKETPKDRYVEHWELWAVAKAGSELLKRYLALLYFTGQRPSDVVGLRRDQLKHDGIMFRQAKTGKKVLVGWSPALRVLTKGSGEWVFQRGKKPYTYWAMNSAFRRAIKKAKLPEPFSLQDIRAKAASDGPDEGLLGHASADFTRRVYVRRPRAVKPVQ